MRHPALALLLLIAALLGIAAPPAAAQGSGSSPGLGGFSARALGPDDEISPDTYFKLKLRPGESFSGRMLVVSSSEKDLRLRLYSVDGLTGTTSGTVYANRDDPRKGASRWITPRKAILRLPAGGDRKVGFDVRVPADATPGDHVGGLALQLADQPKAKGQFGIAQINRVAIAVQITVEGPASAALEPSRIALKALPGTQIPSVEVRLQNTGDLLCRPKLAVSLTTAEGTVLGTLERQLDTLLPGADIPYPLQWAKPLAAGEYEATAVTTGCGPRRELTSQVALAGALRGSAQDPGTIIEPDSGGGIPWWVLVIAVVVALGGGFLIARRRPRRDAGDPPVA